MKKRMQTSTQRSVDIKRAAAKDKAAEEDRRLKARREALAFGSRGGDVLAPPSIEDLGDFDE